MSTKLFLSLALTLGLSACVTDDEDEPVSTDDQDQIATDPGAGSDEPGDPNVVTGNGNITCGGQPRLKADGACVPK